MKKIILLTVSALLMTATASAAKLSCRATMGSDGTTVALKMNSEGDLEGTYKQYSFQAVTVPGQLSIIVTNNLTSETMSSSSNEVKSKSDFAALRYTSHDETIDVFCKYL